MPVIEINTEIMLLGIQKWKKFWGIGLGNVNISKLYIIFIKTRGDH